MSKVWRTLGILSGLLIPALLPAATHTWTGAVSSSWSNNANWIGGTPAGDPAADLMFPSSLTASLFVSTDDIPGVTFVNSIRFSVPGYTVNSVAGSSVALAGGIQAAAMGTCLIDLPIALYGGVDHVIFPSAPAGSEIVISGVISGPASDGLVFQGLSGGLGNQGNLHATLSGNNTYSGVTTVVNSFIVRASLTVLGFQPNSKISGNSQLSGTGTVGPLEGNLVSPGTSVPGILTSIGNAVSLGLKVRLNGTTPGTQYDRLTVQGSVPLMNSTLFVDLGFVPAVGDTFTILQATGGLTGTFSSYPEGTVFSVNCLNFQIHYTSNSVVLTRVAGGGPPLEDVSIATSGSRTVCTNGTGGAVTVSDTGGCGNTHQWGFRTVSGGAITPISGETGTSYTIDGNDFPGTGTFYLVETTTPGFGSPVTSNELTVTVVPPPTAIASGSATVCKGAGALLSGSGASSCVWTPSTGLSDATSCTPLASPAATTTYSLSVMGVTGCTSTNTAQVTVTIDPSCTGPVGPLSFYTVEPCRIADTREFIGSYGGPSFSANEDREFPLSGICGIPEGARALALNVTVTNPTAAGHLTLHPGGTPVPAASTINFRAHQTRANNAAARVSANAVLDVFCGMPSGTVDVILDVVGYYR